MSNQLFAHYNVFHFGYMYIAQYVDQAIHTLNYLIINLHCSHTLTKPNQSVQLSYRKSRGLTLQGVMYRLEHNSNQASSCVRIFNDMSKQELYTALNPIMIASCHSMLSFRCATINLISNLSLESKLHQQKSHNI